MTREEAIKWVDIARISYICDQQECGLKKGEFPCSKMNCDEIHDALSMAKEALEKQMTTEMIHDTPTIEAEPVKHGHWIDINGNSSLYECSLCGEQCCCEGNYCSNCGAKMEDSE